jgi:hypothetical protein
MKYTVKKLVGNKCEITLIPETPEQEKLLADNKETESFEMHYHAAIEKHIGSNASLLKVIDDTKSPATVIAKYQVVKGLGT